MAYGVTAGTLLMASGISPVYSSASIHASEIFTSGISGFMHLKFGNVNKKLLKTLIVPGAIGAVLGALSLVYLGEIAKRFLVPLVSVYTFVLGILILKKALGKKVKKERIGKVGWLASFGGYMDAVGGGGWGPIVSSTLIAKGRDPVFTIGSVNLAEFFVSISSAFTFAFVLGMAHIDVTGGLIVGGALTAPIAAKIFKSIPVKLMMIMCIRTQMETTQYHEHSTPLFLTSSFVFDDLSHGKALFDEEACGNIYSRFSNPNVTEFIQKVCALEDAEDGQSFSSGMSAIFSTFATLLHAGDHLVSQKELFGSTHQILNNIFPKWGISCTYVSSNDPYEWEKAFTPKTKLVYLETPSNPGLKLYDIKKIADISHAHGAILIVDNCFATPISQLPIKLGADVVLHSATKFMDGQGRVLGGIVVGHSQFINQLRFFARHTGPALSPFNAWILSKGIETLEIRMEKHCQNALQLATFLQNSKKIKSTRYPFLPSHPQYELAHQQMKYGGALVTIELNGGFQETKTFYDSLRIASRTSNLGDTRTIVTHPATTTHSKLSLEERRADGIMDSLVRISVGLENIDDLIEDFEQALNTF
ncbi:hypothetical protein CHS0354_000677 [Potamilus streckersoni]|uniref:plant cystathionine gamma-synthase n=1 Tax=Potamilus streckersoni TaxID=2493646 RepID=A0AAE0W954_9BIVA|nr:hypothetical protein CHS0354_000677 [Potamilus streckersoni]